MNDVEHAEKLVGELFQLKFGTDIQISGQMHQLLRDITPELVPHVIQELFKKRDGGRKLLYLPDACGSPLFLIVRTIAKLEGVPSDTLQNLARILEWPDIVHQFDYSLVNTILEMLRGIKDLSPRTTVSIKTFIGNMENWQRQQDIIDTARAIIKDA
ncbi:hypothetical protein KJA15_03615 [Patescibacteria group bacterium]|nr:hypothetical protein [Patescibacteria group bacterium]